MEKKDCVLSVRCTFEIKNQLIEEAKLLGITLSEYAEMCILKFLKEGKQNSSLEKRILQEELTEKNNKKKTDNDKGSLNKVNKDRESFTSSIFDLNI